MDSKPQAEHFDSKIPSMRREISHEIEEFHEFESSIMLALTEEDAGFGSNYLFDSLSLVASYLDYR
ncbi:MAG TPA: hypothetical protein PLS50_05755 [Candidatus Dojkabacteria bacterium]|nr:hypothetical protein [Candidatus Dojkabacteria bacterium]